jgi:diaminohydroxyphosphoribosylaminopyrimidine deaminase / 5-amino-6-(5-phosphoribosylamino)uracil reductase
MEHIKFLTRCLQLANYARGSTSPNPMVGAVIVHKGIIIGEGYHKRAGHAHAEVAAIQEVRDTQLLKESILYCSLEPCSHYGKTPPCCELIANYNIPHVVIATHDPHEKVNGKGISYMRNMGIRVELIDKQSVYQKLNAEFLSNKIQSRPHFTLKWAETASGHIDGIRSEGGSALSISGPIAALKTHQLRSRVDGILISSKTASKDLPSLSTRHWHGYSPTPIILLSNSHPLNSDWLNSFSEKPIIIGLDAGGTTGIKADPKQPKQWLRPLLERNMYHILVEGGGTLLNFFIRQGLADEVHRYTSKVTLHAGIAAPEYNLLLSSNRLGEDYYERN